MHQLLEIRARKPFWACDFDGTQTFISGNKLTNMWIYDCVCMVDEIKERIFKVNFAAFLKRKYILTTTKPEKFNTHTIFVSAIDTGEIRLERLAGDGKQMVVEIKPPGNQTPEFYVNNQQALFELIFNHMITTPDSNLHFIRYDSQNGRAYNLMGSLLKEATFDKSIDLARKIANNMHKLDPHHENELFKLVPGVLDVIRNNALKFCDFTRNYREYILAMLIFNGMPEDEIRSLSLHERILDSRSLKGKDIMLSEVLELEELTPSYVVIADDHPEDFIAMVRAAAENLTKADNECDIFGFQLEVGRYDFLSICANIETMRGKGEDEDPTKSNLARLENYTKLLRLCEKYTYLNDDKILFNFILNNLQAIINDLPETQRDSAKTKVLQTILKSGEERLSEEKLDLFISYFPDIIEINQQAICDVFLASFEHFILMLNDEYSDIEEYQFEKSKAYLLILQKFIDLGSDSKVDKAKLLDIIAGLRTAIEKRVAIEIFLTKPAKELLSKLDQIESKIQGNQNTKSF